VFHRTAIIGHGVPVRDSQAEFGSANMLVETMPQSHSMACAVGQERCVPIRVRGATCAGAPLKEAMFVSTYVKENADLLLRTLPPGKPTYPHARRDRPGTGRAAVAMLLSEVPQNRTWDHRLAWAGLAGFQRPACAEISRACPAAGTRPPPSGGTPAPPG